MFTFWHFLLIPRAIKIFLLTWWLPMLTFAQSPDSLSQYFTPVSLEHPDSAWQVLKPELQGKKLFLFGEAHGNSINKILQLSLLKFLYKQANVRYLILEDSPENAFLYNHYLRTGEKKYLLQTAYWDFKDYRQFWDKLYDFNKYLPEDEKIRVFGVDTQNNIALVESLIVMFWNDNLQDSLPSQLLKVAGQIDYCIKTLKGYKKLRKLLKSSFKKYPRVYKKYLGKHFPYFDYIVHNSLRDGDKNRDLKMAQNFLRVMKEFRVKCNLISINGLSHISFLDKNYLYHINQDSIFHKKGNILAIYSHYQNCDFLFQKKILKMDIGILDTYEALKKKINEKISNDITLIEFLEDNLSEEYKIDFGLKYLLYIKNQPAETYLQLPIPKLMEDDKR